VTRSEATQAAAIALQSANWHAIADDSIVAIVAVITARDTLLAQIPIAQRRS
jgi:uncharacterized membrane protein